MNGHVNTVEEQRDYWFYVANQYIDIFDWICNEKLSGYDVADLIKEYEEKQ